MPRNNSSNRQKSKRRKSVKPCPPGQIRNPLTNRCRKITSPKRKPLSTDIISGKCKSPKKLFKKRPSPGQSATECNLETIALGQDGNKWEIKKTKQGVKRWVKINSKRKNSSKRTLAKCPPGKIRNLVTNRCIKRKSAKRKSASKRKSSKRKSSKRKSASKRKSSKRKSVSKRKSSKRKSASKRKSSKSASKRKSVSKRKTASKRKSSKRKSASKRKSSKSSSKRKSASKRKSSNRRSASNRKPYSKSSKSSKSSKRKSSNRKSASNRKSYSKSSKSSNRKSSKSSNRKSLFSKDGKDYKKLNVVKDGNDEYTFDELIDYCEKRKNNTLKLDGKEFGMAKYQLVRYDGTCINVVTEKCMPYIAVSKFMKYFQKNNEIEYSKLKNDKGNKAKSYESAFVRAAITAYENADEDENVYELIVRNMFDDEEEWLQVYKKPEEI